MKLIIFIGMITALFGILVVIKRKKVVIRKARNLKDFKNISKVLYEVYGDTYPYKTIYNPKESYNLYLNKKAISYVAIDKWRLLGHVSLIKDEKKNICEMATAFVNPKYRGNGTLMELVNVIMKDCNESGNIGVYVNSVCGHTYSQKVAYNGGFNECAIMLGKMVPLNFKSIEGQWNERESLVTSFKYLKNVNEKKLYLCNKHKKIVEEIYKNLGVRVRFIDDNNKEGIHYLTSKIEIDKLEDNSAFINIIEVGNDVIRKVIENLNMLIDSGIKSIIFTMNLHEKSTKYISNELEKYGIFFAGILPADDKEDLLMMQFITEDINYANVKILTNNGKKLLDYIKVEHYYANERKEINEF